MNCYVDTSAFLAVVDAGDLNHARADEVWRELLAEGGELACSNYVIVETLALLQHRLGFKALRAFHDDVLPILTVLFINVEVHAAAVTRVLQAARRKLSLVDCASFEVMRKNGLNRVFCFDPHFEEHGFARVPAARA